MSSDVDSATKSKQIKILDWNSLVQYTLFLCQGDEQKMKICLIDEEQEQIRIKSKEEFESNIKCAQDQGLSSLVFLIYRGDQLLFEGFYEIEKVLLRFPADKLKILEEKALAEKWYIPVKQGEALDICLRSSIEFVQKRRENLECNRFVELVLPEIFRKLLTTPSVYSWPREIQNGIFEMIELLIDLIGVRTQQTPIPVELLKLLGMVFDCTTTFAKRHKHKALPNQRSYNLPDQEFLQKTPGDEQFGWLRSFLQRFLAQEGLKHLRQSFDYVDSSNPDRAATEYEVLLRVFLNCPKCINEERFRIIFTRPVHQAMQYVKRQNSTENAKQLERTLKEISNTYRINDELDQTLAATFNPKISEKSIENLDEATSFFPRKSKSVDETEIISDDLMNLKIKNSDDERKNIKKQRTEEKPSATLFNRSHLRECIDEILKNNDKRLSKQKHRRKTVDLSETGSTENKSSFPPTTFDRSNSEEIIRFYGPMKMKVEQLYDDRDFAISRGNVRELLKIEEKLKLLRPYSARFVGDENTPDGTVMTFGKVFRKGWTIFNDGSLPWDNETVKLINLSDGIEVLNKPIVPITAPHSKASITIDFVCSNNAGNFESKWILAHRNQTFGPMIWCSIEVRPTTENSSSLTSSFFRASPNSIEENFQFVDVNLPECFDLSKPFRSQNSTKNFRNSISSDLNEIRFDSSEDSTKRSSISVGSTTNETKDESIPLIDFVNEEEKMKNSNSGDFVELFVNNICNVTNQARNTAKAIFNSLQAIEEIRPAASSTENFQQAENSVKLVNSYQFIPKPSSTDPMTRLVEMGFANRPKNQRLLRENFNDIEKVIELLAEDSSEDPDWFKNRH